MHSPVELVQLDDVLNAAKLAAAFAQGWRRARRSSARRSPAVASSRAMLLLFDIDGTLLLKASREHAESMYAALRRIHRLQELPTGQVEAAGRTDDAIARSILTLAGVSAERIDDRARDVQAMACAEFAHRCPGDLSTHLAPGVPEVLELLAARDDVDLALLTGNLECVARLKVDRAGIGHHFARGQGAFGSDSEDRADLPEIARARHAAATAARPIRASRPSSSATRRATSPAPAPTASTSSRSRPARSGRPTSPAPTSSSTWPARSPPRWRGSPASSRKP